MKTFSRRSFLGTTLVTIPLIGCRTAQAQAEAVPDAPRRDACAAGIATETNIEGPYYRPDAPFRSDLVDAGIPGRPLLLTGTVLSLDCRSPLEDAVLDVWQADGTGHYDNDGSFARETMRLRGRVKVGRGGAFSIRTVVPGRYLNGRQYRPAHVHVKVTAKAHEPLTTQLYFPGDPYNDVDPFIRKSLVMDLSNDRGHFDFVLVPTRS